MSFLMVVAVFPLLLMLLALGTGLLIERAAGTRLPLALVPVCGFAGLVVVSQFTTWKGATAPATPWILLALALAGLLLGRRELIHRWRARARAWWSAPGAALATYLTVSAPILASGRLTSPGYLLDTTGAIQLAGAERLLHHGRDFTNGFPGYGATLVAYFGNGYPSGGHTVLASVGWLSGQDLFWLYAPFQAAELALCALVLTFLASRAGLPRVAAAVAGWIAAVPALVYSYALMGSIKELTALPLLLLMGALVVLARSLARRGLRATLPFAVAGAGALGAIGIAASPWVGLFALAMLLFAAPVVALRRRAREKLAAYVVTLGALTAVLALPTLGPLSKSVNLATGLQSSNHAAASDPGNLLRPLRFVQTFGVWLGETHRLDPKYLEETYVLIGIVATCAVLGLIWLVRRRAWTLLAVCAISVFVWAFLTTRGTEWTNAKLLMLLSPVVVLVAFVGAFAALRGRKMEGALLAGVITVAVLASNALAYHATGLSATQRYKELRSIGQRFEGDGPALMTDFDDYGMYFLRKDQLDAPGYAYHGPLRLADGSAPLYGHSYDVDQLEPSEVQRFNLIVQRRSPAWSRPPSNYTLIWNGSSYRVWRRTAPAPATHLGLGTGLQPVASAPCPSIRRLALAASREHRRLRIATRPPNLIIDMAAAARSAKAVPLADSEGMLEYAVFGPVRIEVDFPVPARGSYALWLGGNVDRPLHVLLDGRLVGTPSEILGGDANRYQVATVQLSRGSHKLTLIRGGGSLKPGDNASTVIDGALLAPAGAERDTLASVAPERWRSLCGRPVDWLEVD